MEDAEAANLEPKAIGTLWQNMCSKLVWCVLVMSESRGVPEAAAFQQILEKKWQNYRSSWARL